MPIHSEDDTLTPSAARGLRDTTASDVHPAQLVGALPDRYRLGAVLGAGGMGEVVLATDTQIGRDVAIKRMRLAPSPGLRTRFVREARVQGRLDHPAIVPVHELGEDSHGQPFFVMKRLAGKTLAAHLAAGTKTRQQLLRALAEVCLAVELAHTRGVVHRDLKPANIVLGDFGEVYVLDWGLARIADVLESPGSAGARSDAERGAESIAEPADDTAGAEPSGRGLATEVGAILGTPGYIAPELLAGGVADARADVYALGSILFELVAGESMIPAGVDATDPAAVAVVDTHPAQRAPDHDVPPELDTLVVDATGPHADRLASARALAERLERYLDGDRDAARRRQLAAGHLAAARAAIATGDGEQTRATAMREAGRALALDPAGDAAALIAQLVLEPTGAVPRDVHQRVDAIEGRIAREKTYSVTTVGLSYFVFIPLMLWIGVREMWWVWLFAAIALIDVVSIRLVTHNRTTMSPLHVYGGIAVNCVFTAVMARMFTPVLVAPGVAAVSLAIFGVDPRVRGWLVVSTHLAAVAIPWLLEATGVLSPTMSAVDGDFVLHAPALVAHLPAVEVTLAAYVASLIAIAGYAARRVGHTTREALQRTELQAWHMRQIAAAPLPLP